uniref:ABC transporter permease n=1 Tax=uncultured Allobacillus sp. TaxID=1638025 RepID=UPI00259A8BE4|nr:ABC transporter permease subunit [uncultured Allobacillus sp.]
MIHILTREFLDSFKSVRSILIILFITFVSYQSATFIDSNPGLIEDIVNGGEEGSAYTAAIALIVLILGFLFVFATSHDLINKEIELKTMRLLVTKTSRVQIMVGKFLGTLLFWVATITISFAVIFIISGSWFLKDYFHSFVFLFYIVSFVVLVSTVFTKSKLTMFLGILFGIALPILGLTSTVSNKWYLVPFKYLLPYRYLEGSIALMFVPIVIGAVYLLIAVFIMQRKDL